MRPVEYSHPHFRAIQPAPIREVRAAGRFSSGEVTELMARTGIRDLRQLGCPETLFLNLLERKAAEIRFVPAPQPAPAPVPDLADRLDAISLF